MLHCAGQVEPPGADSADEAAAGQVGNLQRSWSPLFLHQQIQQRHVTSGRSCPIKGSVGLLVQP